MGHLPLKNYQRESLEILADYAAAVRTLTLSDAAFPEADAFKLATERDYYSTPNFGRIPYVCLRVPTGGGKTLLASHAI
jgi:type III restriction enzyme